MIPPNEVLMGAMEELAQRSQSTSRDALVFPSHQTPLPFSPATNAPELLLCLFSAY